MQRLCAPDRVLHLIEYQDEDHLKALQKQYNLSAETVRNLRQLLGWTRVGTAKGGRNDRAERFEADNWQIVYAAAELTSSKTVQWLRHDIGSELVPLVGKLKHKFDTVVSLRPDMRMSPGSLKNLLNGSKKHIGQWKLVEMPPQVYSLGNGSSLTGIHVCARQQPPTVRRARPPAPMPHVVPPPAPPRPSKKKRRRRRHPPSPPRRAVRRAMAGSTPRRVRSSGSGRPRCAAPARGMHPGGAAGGQEAGADAPGAHQREAEPRLPRHPGTRALVDVGGGPLQAGPLLACAGARRARSSQDRDTLHN